MPALPIDPAPNGGTPSSDELLRIYSERVDRLVALEAQVGAAEVDLADFRVRFGAHCGRLASELADLELEIAQLFHERRPDDPVLEGRLREAEVAAGKRHELEDAAEGELPTSPAPRAPEAQALFHAIARRVHPDLARDPAEAQARHDAMVHLNWLYARGDTQGLHEMLQDCMRAAAFSGGGAAPDLDAYLVEAIAAMNRRIEILEARLVDLGRCDDAVLRDEMLGGLSEGGVDGGAGGAGDPFERLAGEFRRRIVYTRQRLEQLRRPGGGR